MDRVQVIKQEWPDLGGDAADEMPYAVPIEPQEDAIEAAGVFLQDVTHRDETTRVSRSGDDMLFKDGNNPVDVTLTELLEGAADALTETEHKALRHLIHFIDSGPADGFASGAYREITGQPFPTSVVWWESAAKLKKLVELTVTRNANKTPATVKWEMFDTDGSTVLATVTDTISYSGAFETSRVRTWS